MIKMEIDTKEMMKQFMEAVKVRGKEYEKKQIKLREVNCIKFCINCKEPVKIVLNGLDGFCERCKEKLYTIRNNEKRIYEENKEKKILNTKLKGG